MPIRLAELAEIVCGELTGDGHLLIEGAATLSQATDHDITLADRAQLLDALHQSSACAAIVSAEVIPSNKSYITVEDARAAFARVVREFSPSRQRKKMGISPAAHVDPTAKLGQDTDIHPSAVIEQEVVIGERCVIHSGAVIMSGCQIGNDCEVFPRAVLYPETVLGDRVTIHGGAVIGADGFGFKLVEGRHELAAQLGHVRIGDDVVVGANSTIDRGSYSATRIGDGTKIDNLVMIGHNCQIGRHNLLCAQVGIAGSVTTGDYVVMGGQVGVRDHVEIASGVQLGAQSGVGESISNPGKYLGAPAIPLRKEIQVLLARQKIPEMRREIARLRKKCEQAPASEEV